MILGRCAVLINLLLNALVSYEIMLTRLKTIKLNLSNFHYYESLIGARSKILFNIKLAWNDDVRSSKQQ